MERDTACSTGLSAISVKSMNVHKSLKFLKLKETSPAALKRQQPFDCTAFSADYSLLKNYFWEVCNYFGETCYLYIKTIILLVSFKVIELGRSA
jgi:hypothetical protein